MKHKDYLPDGDGDKATWLLRFDKNLPTYAATLGISNSRLAELHKDAEYFAFIMGLLDPFKNYSKSLVDYKNRLRDGEGADVEEIPALPNIGAHTAVRPGIFHRVSALVRQIKAHPDYNTTIGHALEIIGAEISVDYSTARPNPKAMLRNGHAYLMWDNMHADGANIAADYEGGNQFKLIGYAPSGHFLDPHTPPPGQMMTFAYVVRLLVGQEEVGSWSDPVKVVITGQEWSAD